MKRCPVCQRAYPDDSQIFCLDDGATLLSADAPQQNPYANRSAQTDVMYPAPVTDKMRAPVAPPFTSYATPKKSALPWILAVAGLLVVGIIVTIFLVLKKSSNVSWETLNGDKFNVSMPGTPTKSEQTQTTVAGPVPIKMHTLDKGSEAYVVGYSEYPAVVFTSQGADAILNGARDGIVNNMKGQILSEHPITQGTYVGKEITGKITGQSYSFIAHLYIANPRMYILIYVKQGDDSSSDNGRKFLDSFKITSQ